MSLTSERAGRVLLVAAAMVGAAAVVVAVGAVPPVSADVHPQATPERAVAALWVSVAMNLLAALALVVGAMRQAARGCLSTTTRCLEALVLLLLAVALGDAGAAMAGHGPALRSATVSLFLAGALDLGAALLVVASIFLAPKRPTQAPS